MAILKVTPSMSLFRGNLRRKIICLASIMLLAIHFWWHFSRGNTHCNNEVNQKDTSDKCSYIKQDISSDRPIVGCTTTGRPIYKDVTRVMGTGLKTKVFLTIGIPTIERVYKNVTSSYLEKTLDIILSRLTPDEMRQVHIVVFLADQKKQARDNVKEQLFSKYQQFIDRNFINVIEAPRKFYPKLKSLARTFGDSPGRVFWRSKQNLDYAFLFNYCDGLSDYYLQIEDDVKASENFLSTTKRCIEQNRNSSLAFIETTGWGFVGKLFRNEELDYFARILRMFYNDMPCDWLLPAYAWMRGEESPGSDRLCGNTFSHIGKLSSKLIHISKD